MTGNYRYFREFRQEYNLYTRSNFNRATGKIDQNFNALCISNSLGIIDWKLGKTWYPTESEFMLVYTTHMKELLINRSLPKPSAFLPDMSTQILKTLKKTRAWKKPPDPNPTPTPKELAASPTEREEGRGPPPQGSESAAGSHKATTPRP